MLVSFVLVVAWCGLFKEGVDACVAEMERGIGKIERNGLPSEVELRDPRAGRWLDRPLEDNHEGGDWLPTKWTSPYKVLTAGVLQNDFYANNVSWGKESIAIGLLSEVLVLKRGKTCFISSVDDVVSSSDTPCGRLDGGVSDAASSESHSSSGTSPPGGSPRPGDPSSGLRPTTVSVMREEEAEVFLGLSNGMACLLRGRPDGSFCRQQSFDMPPTSLTSFMPRTMNMNTIPRYGSGESNMARVPANLVDGRQLGLSDEMRRYRELLAQHADGLTSVGCSATCGAQPHEVVVGTSCHGLLLLDKRCRTPSLAMSFSSATRLGSGGVSRISDMYSPGNGGCGLNAGNMPDGVVLDAGPPCFLRSPGATLLQNERLCSVTWSANGSFVAAGGADGVVTIWALSAPREPLHRVVVDAQCAAKAVTFHPYNPYELALGSSAGEHGIRVYDISSPSPRLTYAGRMPVPMTQVVYSPDGGHLVSSHGSTRAAVSRRHLDQYLTSSSPSPSGSAHTRLGPYPSDSFPSRHRDPYGGGPTRHVDYRETDNGRGTGTGTGGVTPTSFCLTVWRKGRLRPHPLSDLLSSSSPDSTRPAALSPSHLQGGSLSASHPHETSGGHLPLLPVHVLTGHKDRPLYLSAPYVGSSQDGHLASASGGRDKSLRFWKVFQQQGNHKHHSD